MPNLKLIGILLFCIGAIFYLLQLFSGQQSAQEMVSNEAWYEIKLPKKLREASGLTVSPDSRLLSHTDEKAIIYQLHPHDNTVSVFLKLGSPVIRGDFEGIAFHRQDLYLLTSNGLLFRVVKPLLIKALSTEQEASARQEKYVEPELIDTNLASFCEFEGLASYRENLLLICKEVYQSESNISPANIVIKTFNPDTGVVGNFQLDYPFGLENPINPSGLVVANGKLLIIAARQNQLLIFDLNGNFEQEITLDSQRHRQAEGIAVLEDFSLAIVNEGNGKKARLIIYSSLRSLVDDSL